MQKKFLWQKAVIDRLTTLLRGKEGIGALVLTGSLADPNSTVDEWSDIDLKVILSDDSSPDYDSCPDWLSAVGAVIGFQRICHGCITTLRVCLEEFRRLDITIIPESMFAADTNWPFNPFQGIYKVLWSDLAGLEQMIASMPEVPPDPLSVPEGPSGLADDFWFTAALALSKAVRNDLLVALHLGFDLARKCLELQMMLRDRELGTNVHREGGWGNDLVQRLATGTENWSAEEIVDFIAGACRLFDELIPELGEEYAPRFERLSTTFKRARSKGTGL